MERPNQENYFSKARERIKRERLRLIIDRAYSDAKKEIRFMESEKNDAKVPQDLAVKNEIIQEYTQLATNDNIVSNADEMEIYIAAYNDCFSKGSAGNSPYKM